METLLHTNPPHPCLHLLVLFWRTWLAAATAHAAAARAAAQSKRVATMVAASTVVDVASIDIDDMSVWEPFRMFVLMKEVRVPPPLPPGTRRF